MTKSDKKIEGGVRKYADYGLLHSWRRYWCLRSVGRSGDQVNVARNVRLLRFPQNVFLGNRVMLKEGARICPTNPEARIEINDWTTIGYHTYIFASSSVKIGKNCLLAPFCYLVDANHGIDRESLIRLQPMTTAAIDIGNDVWLGTHVIVTAGVTIGSGAVVAAGSVVKDDIPEYAIAAGNPAKVVGQRD